MAFCRKCGTRNLDDAVFCEGCGEPLAPGASASRRAGDALDAAPTATTLTTGTLLLNRYRIERLLGQGGMGQVYLAHDQTLRNLPVAIKTMSVLLQQDPQAVERLKDEALAAMQLAHPHIVRVNQFEDGATLKFLVMEYVEGGTLAQRLARETHLAEDEARRIGIALCDALEHAHGKGVLHRDVKPGNVLLGKSGEVKLADFGIARVARDSVSRLTGVQTSGTLLYMAPEQVEGEASTPRSDLYALGAVLYEILAGAPPFHTGDLTHQILRKAPKALEGASSDLNAVVLRLLAKAPAERWASAREVREELDGTAARRRAEEARAREVAEAEARRAEEEGRRRAAEEQQRREADEARRQQEEARKQDELERQRLQAEPEEAARQREAARLREAQEAEAQQAAAQRDAATAPSGVNWKFVGPWLLGGLALVVIVAYFAANWNPRQVATSRQETAQEATSPAGQPPSQGVAGESPAAAPAGPGTSDKGPPVTAKKGRIPMAPPIVDMDAAALGSNVHGSSGDCADDFRCDFETAGQCGQVLGATSACPGANGSGLGFCADGRGRLIAGDRPAFSASDLEVVFSVKLARLPGPGEHGAGLVTKYVGGSQARSEWGIWAAGNNGPPFWFLCGDGRRCIESDKGIIQTGVAYVVRAVFLGDHADLWVDGQRVASGSISRNPGHTTTPVVIGGSAGGDSTSPFFGMIDDVRIGCVTGAK